MAHNLPSPPRGWNSFDSFGGYLHEKAALAQLEAQAARLAPHGYDIFVVDIGWYGEYDLKPGTRFPSPRSKHALDIHLDAHGLPLPSMCYFPRGFRGLIGRTHELGLQFGLHLMRGVPRKAVERRLPVKNAQGVTAADIADPTSTCPWCHYNYGINMNKPGAQAYYDALIAQVADWGVDFIKFDDITAHPREIEAVVEAISRSGRRMTISLSPGGDTDPHLLPVYEQCDMLRITKDIWDERESIERSFHAWTFWQPFSRPGFWPDLDMIPFGDLQTMSPEPAAHELPEGTNPSLCGKGFTRRCRLSLDERRTFITQRAMSASPLFIGGDLTTLPEEDVRLLTAPQMLACNRNGVSGSLRYMLGDVQVWHVVDQSDPRRGWLGVFNRNPAGQPESLVLTPKRLNLPPDAALYDVWQGRSLGALADKPRIELPPSGCSFLAYGVEQPSRDDPSSPTSP